jgi:hypothetical protein
VIREELKRPWRTARRYELSIQLPAFSSVLALFLGEVRFFSLVSWWEIPPARLDCCWISDLAALNFAAAELNRALATRFRAGAAGRGGGLDDGAGLRGVGRQERRCAGLLHGLLQDPRDAQAEQAGALQGQPRRRRGPPPGAAGQGAGGGAACQVLRRRRGRRRPPPPAARRLPHGN